MWSLIESGIKCNREATKNRSDLTNSVYILVKIAEIPDKKNVLDLISLASKHTELSSPLSAN